MKLLVVMADYPFPPLTGSSIVAFNQLKNLSTRHDLRIVCCDLQKERRENSGFLNGVEIVTRRRLTGLALIACFLRGAAFVVAEYSSKEMRARVGEIVARDYFDVVLLYGLFTIQYCPESIYGRIIVNIEDPPSIKLCRFSKLSILRPAQRIKWALHAFFTKRYEIAILPKLAKVLTLSEVDMHDMQLQGKYHNVGQVSYGVDSKPDTEIIGPTGRTSGMIVFSGNMFHVPNVDGILFFLKHTFSEVLKQYQSAKLWIVGAQPDPRIRNAATKFGSQVVITGKVDDVSHYLRRAAVCICPVQLKIGVQTKILEALSWATPVVTTSAGNSGVGGQSGSDLWVEDDPIEFARRVVSLLDGENWTQFSENGRKLVSKRFSWERSVAELEHHIELTRVSN